MNSFTISCIVNFTVCRFFANKWKGLEETNYKKENWTVKSKTLPMESEMSLSY